MTDITKERLLDLLDQHSGAGSSTGAYLASNDEFVSILKLALQASSVIAGLTAERDEAADRAKVWEHYWSQEVKVKSEVASWAKEAMDKVDAAEARISSLEEQNKRLREANEALMRERTSMIAAHRESIDRLTLKIGVLEAKAEHAARQALGDHNG